MSSSTLTTTGAWTAAHALPVAAAWFGQHDGPVLLDSGKVLVVGGADATGAALGQAVLYDPAADTWSPAGTGFAPRRLHTATRLASGKVLVTGGLSGTTPLAGAQIYDPAGNTWSPAHDLTTARYGHSAVLLPGGQVLVAGGTATRAIRSAELYDPDHDTWTATGDLTDPRTGHPAVVLQGGKVLVAGGEIPVGGPEPAALAFCELYDPAAGTWTPTGNLLHPRTGHRATPLSPTTVLVTGGQPPGAPGDATFDPFARRTAEAYDLATGAWTAVPDMPAGRALHVALSAGSKILVAGGVGGGHDEAGFRSAVLYDPVAKTWSPAGGLATGRWACAAVPLAGGKVLVAGGVARAGLAAADPAALELTATGETYGGGA